MYIALDTETTGLDYWAEAFLVSYALRDSKERLVSGVFNANDGQHMDTLYDLVRLKHPVFHNAKFDVQKIQKLIPEWIPDWTKIHDTECLAHLVNEQQKKGLKDLAKNLLGLETDEAEAIREARKKLKLRKADGYDALPREVVEPYARKDAEFTLQLFEYLYPIVKSDPELLRLYREEQELMEIFYNMEATGMGVDMEYVNEKTKEYAKEILRLDLCARDLVGDEEFNPGSWQQITEALEKRGHKVSSTSKEVLLSLDDVLARTILEFRAAKKIYSTYFRALQTEVRGDILHPNFKQWGTRGRRFSSGGEKES